MLEKAASLFLRPEIAGAVFQKELRVSSRRRRTYVLRAGYLAALAVFLLISSPPLTIWSAAGRAARSVQATDLALGVTVAVFLFQLVAGTIVAAAMLSGSISEELRRRTLPVLFTTSLSSFRIVLGKLLSRLFQLVLLMALSLPVLALLRLYGGVPWRFLVNGAVISIASVLVAGALSMFLSLWNRKAHHVFFQTVFLLLFLNTMGFLVMLANSWGWLARFPDADEFADLATYFSPFATLAASLPRVFILAPAAAAADSLCLGHCVVALAQSALLVALTTLFLRRVALRGAGGREKGGQKTVQWEEQKIRSLTDPPVLWKEKHSSRALRKVGGERSFLLLVVVLAVSYVLWGKAVASAAVQSLYAFFLLVVCLLGTLSAASETIAGEKEARTWELLLLTPLSGHEIAIEKFKGVMYRTAHLWFLFFGHFFIFAVLTILNRVITFVIIIYATEVGLFVAALGVFLSARARSSTRALVGGLLTLFVLWGPGALFLFFLGSFLQPFLFITRLTSMAATPGFFAKAPWARTMVLESVTSVIVASIVCLAGVLTFLYLAGNAIRPGPLHPPEADGAAGAAQGPREETGKWSG